MDQEVDVNFPAKIAAAEGTDRRKQINELLQAYPAISEAERRSIVTFLREGPILEVGLLSAIDGAGPRLAAFRRDHARELGLRPIDWLRLALLVVAFLALCALLWDSGI